MSHPARDELVEYLKDGLNDQQTLLVSEHLDNCATCQSKVNEIITRKFSAFLPQGPHFDPSRARPNADSKEDSQLPSSGSEADLQ